MKRKEFEERLFDKHPKHFTGREMKLLTDGLLIGNREIEGVFIKPRWRFAFRGSSLGGTYIKTKAVYDAIGWSKPSLAKLASGSTNATATSPKHSGIWYSAAGHLKYIISKPHIEGANQSFYVGSVFGLASDGVVGEHFAGKTVEAVERQCRAFAKQLLGSKLISSK
jgi:hypothetical protein